MKNCPSCDEPNVSTARRCKSCEELLPHDELAEIHAPKRAISIAAEFAFFAGPFLPYAEAGQYAQHGLVKSGPEAVTMLCAGSIAIVFSVMSLVLRRRYTYWYLPCAAATGAMTFYTQLAVQNDLIAQHLTTTRLGLGIDICYLGAVLSLIAAGVCLMQRPVVPLRARIAGAVVKLGHAGNETGAAQNLIETGFRTRPREILDYRDAIALKGVKRRRRRR